MDYLISLLLALPCVRAYAYYPSAPSPLGFGGRVIQLRRNVVQYHNPGGDSSAEEYEPYAVAAYPLHPPVPVLQLLSPAAYRARPRKPAKHRRPDSDYDAAQHEQAYDPVDYELVSASSEEAPKYARPRDQYDDEDTVVLYARPNKNGGFSYRKPQSTRRVVGPAPTPTLMIASMAAPTPALLPAPASAPAPAPSAPSPTPTPTAAPTTATRPREPQQPVIIRIHKYRVVH